MYWLALILNNFDACQLSKKRDNIRPFKKDNVAEAKDASSLISLNAPHDNHSWKLTSNQQWSHLWSYNETRRPFSSYSVLGRLAPPRVELWATPPTDHKYPINTTNCSMRREQLISFHFMTSIDSSANMFLIPKFRYQWNISSEIHICKYIPSLVKHEQWRHNRGEIVPTNQTAIIVLFLTSYL